MLLDDLRQAIKDDGRSEYRIAAEAGVARSQLTRLAQGYTLTVETVERLADALGYDVRLLKQEDS